MTRNRTKRMARCLVRTLLVCVAMLLAIMPTQTLAQESVQMTEGDVTPGFAPVGVACDSSDPSVVWVDAEGNLNAMKPGDAVVTAGDTTYNVSVGDYSDGSEVVGNLKILARYNDSMQFYDGHVYLLFTSYQDGVQISVPDLYGAYSISDQYYADIRENIANGSNHTGSDADKYFAFTNDTSVTLNRGELVTVGMYRDFNMSVYEAALGSIRNSSLWTELSDTAKTAIVNVLFQFLSKGTIPSEEAAAQIEAVLDKEGLDYNMLLDGVVAGGVCFNRELYNQKLEWDQYENVTYDLDITQNQLNTLVAYLGGNLNHFSILKNSCATVALRAWNAAVGTRDGADTSYKLDATGAGIFSVIDAPKTVRDAIVNRLPGHHLNNAENVAEPDAGFMDDTGCVYVSAPKKVEPIAFTFEEGAVKVDETRSNMAALVQAAQVGASVTYGANPHAQVSVEAQAQGDATTITKVNFDIDGTVVSLDHSTPLKDGIWFAAQAPALQDGEDCYVMDADGNALPSEHADGWVYFHADALPVTYKVAGSNSDVLNVIKTTIDNASEAKATTEVYTKDGDVVVPLGAREELASGTAIYVKAAVADDEMDCVLADITLNGASIMDADHFDTAEGAYAVTMPKKYAKLRVSYQQAVVNAKRGNVVQVSAGDVLDVTDYAELVVGKQDVGSNNIGWRVVSNDDGALDLADADGKTLVATQPGTAVVWAGANGNAHIGVPFTVEVCENTANMVLVTYDEGDFKIMAQDGDKTTLIPTSGYLVNKGAVLSVVPIQTDGTVVSEVKSNGEVVAAGQAITATENTHIAVTFRKAAIKGMPSVVKLGSKDDTYQIDASVSYAGLASLLPVYDKSIRFESSDSLVAVDETGKITITGDVPTDGKAVVVTAYAGSSNRSVSADTKVVVGNYQGAKVVGRLTISARPIVQAQLVSHAAITFTTYKCLDLDVSYYHYYRPTDAYIALMADYRDNPQNYPSDPALYNDDELGLQDRESYFEELSQGAESDPQTVSLGCGESITLSNYGYDGSNLVTILRALENSTISASPATQALIAQMRAYLDNGEIDNGPMAFDSLVATLMEMHAVTSATGQSPADSHSEGGLDINREMYNQFRRDDSQMPNNFYTVEITADELANLQKYLANPQNNVYGLFAKNCATGSVDIWNTTLSDRPELQLTSNYTGLSTDPQSLYFELGKLHDATGKTYEPGTKGKEEGGGKDFYPRTVANCTCDDVVAPKAMELTYSGSAQELVTPGQSPCGTMVYSLDGKSFDEQIPTGTNAGTYTVYYKALCRNGRTSSGVNSVEVTIAKATIKPKVTIKGWAVGQKANKPTVKGNLGGGAVTFVYASKGSKKFSSKVPTAAGDYVVRATIAPTGNYLGGVAKASFSIEEKVAPLPTISMPKARKGLVADGTQQELVTPPSKIPSAYTKVKYSIDNGKTWSAKIPRGKKAGTYVVRVMYVGDQTHDDFYAPDVVKVKIAPMPSASVATHVQKLGWLKATGNGKMAGTAGQALRMEALRISLNNADVSGGIEYRSHVQTLGWEKNWVRDGADTGTTGSSKRLEAIQVRLFGKMAKKYDVYYRVHAQHYGWMGWTKNGAKAGTAGMSYRLEAIQIVLVKKGAAAPVTTYKGITQTYGKAFAQK